MNLLNSVSRVQIAVAFVALGGFAKIAQAELPRQNILAFNVTATREVVQDVLSVTLQATHEGSQASEVQAVLRQVMDKALNDARHVAQGHVGLEVRTGSFSVQPRYTNAGRISGWQGVAQLTLEGTDTAKISQTAGKLTQLNVVGMQYGLSRGLRERHEVELTNEAIQRFRARAGAMAEAFGFKSYTLGEVSISSADPGFEQRPYMLTARVKAMESADSGLPVEPGKGRLSVTVNGQVYLTP